MSQFLKLRRSSIPGKIPTTSSIDFGEIALNTYDGLAFMKKSGSNGEEVIILNSTGSSVSSSLTGTGTADYVARWIDPTTLGIGALQDNGTSIAIGTTPDNNLPIKIVKNMVGTAGLRFENLSPDPYSFSAFQMGEDINNTGTKFLNILYVSSQTPDYGIYRASGSTIFNVGDGGLNLGTTIGSSIRFFNDVNSQVGEIFSSGNWYIGSNPVDLALTKLNVEGNLKANTVKAKGFYDDGFYGTVGMYITGSENNEYIRFHISDTPVVAITIDDTIFKSSLGINNLRPSYNLDVSGSGRFTEGLIITGSLNSLSITGSLQGTASYALKALTASYAPNPLSGGIVNRIPIWTSENTLGNSLFYTSGSFTALNYTGSPEDAGNPEILFINGELIPTYNLISAHGNMDNYVQLNIKNYSSGSNASSDIVATADNGNENSKYIDMGINSSQFANNALVGAANDAYVYSTGNNFYIGNASTGSQLVLFNGGLDANANAKIWIFDQGTVGINTNNYNTINPPSLQIKAPNTSTYNLVQIEGDVNNYSQVGIVNKNAGTNASADLVLYNDIDPTNQLNGYIDIGINSSNYLPNINYPGYGADAYVFTDSHYLLIGATAPTGSIVLFAGSVDSDVSDKLTLRYNNRHSLTGSLEVTGSVTASLYGTASWALNANSASYFSGSVLNAISSSYPIAVTGSTLYSTNPAAGPDFSTTNSIFLGLEAGNGATYAGNSNFIGYQAGSGSNFLALYNDDPAGWTGAYSTFIGYQAGVDAPNADASNFLGNQAGYQATNAAASNFIGTLAGYTATNAYWSNFIGNQAGYSVTNAAASNFLGNSAGYQATNAQHSNFLGYQAGYSASNAYYSNFLGNQAGYLATNAYYSNFLGNGAGYGATDANNSNFLGKDAGQGASDAYWSNFLGNQAGYLATNAYYSNFLGNGAGYGATAASHSLLIGYRVGVNYDDITPASIGSNNIIIGTNITVPTDVGNAINLGAIIFATGSHSDISLAMPFSGSVGNGKVGINQPSPAYALDVSGSGNYTNGLIVTGSLNALSITGSLQGTSSWSQNSITASYATTASYNPNAVVTASAVNTTITFTKGNGTTFDITISQSGSVSTASYAIFAQTANSSSYALTASYVSGSSSISASYATSASYWSGSITNAATASYVLQAISASYWSGSITNALSASYASSSTSASFATLAQTANTASYVNGVVLSTQTGSFVTNAQTSSMTVATASYINGVVLSTQTGSFVTNSQTSSMSVATASYINNVVLSSQTGSFVKNAQTSSMTVLTASYATNALTASYVSGASSISSSYATTSSYAISSSYSLVAQTLLGSVTSASYASTASYINTLNQNLSLTGSFLLSGSTTQTGNNTLIGNTILSGSIVISGSSDPGSLTSSIQIYGNLDTNGYIRFDPVSTNIDNSISASYIYVSGSTQDLYFSQNTNGYNNTTRLRWLEGNLYTGILNGGVITTSSSTVYVVSSGSGIIVNLNASINNDPYPTTTYLKWGNLSASIAPTSASFDQAFIAIYNSGSSNTPAIYASGTPFTDGQFDTLMQVGIVLHQNHSTINGVKTSPSLAYGWKQRSNLFIDSFGPLKLSGFTLAASGSSTGSLIVGSGTAFSDGDNYIIDPNNPSYVTDQGTTVSKIFRYYQSGSAWVYNTNVGAGYETIDPGNYSNSGVLTDISGLTGANRVWTIQRAYWYPNSATKAIVVYYGNATYPTQADAITNIPIEPFIEAANTAAHAIYLGAIIIRNDGVFTTPTSYNIVPGGLFRSIGGSGGGGSIVTQTLSGLSDVNISAPSNGQPLVYNNVAGKWQNQSTLTATLTGNASTATTASYAQTASYVITANTASYILQAVSASYASNSTSASFATLAQTANTASYILQAVSASYVNNVVLSSQTSSFVTNAQTSSMTVATASYVNNVVLSNQTSSFTTNSQTSSMSVASASYAATASLASSYTLTSSFTAFTSSYNSGSFTGSFIGTHTGNTTGTASYASNALTASYVANVVLSAQTSSFITNTQTGSFVTNAQTSSMSVATASYVANAVLTTQTGSFVTNAQTSSMSVASASYASTASLAPRYLLSSSFNSFTSSYNSGSFTGSFIGTHTGNTTGTASYASNALTASYATVAQTLLGSVVSASYASTSSYASNFIVENTLQFNGKIIQPSTNPGIYIGYLAGSGSVATTDNIAIGKSAFQGAGVNSAGNIAIGTDVLSLANFMAFSTVIGNSAFISLSGSLQNNNTGVGAFSGYSLGTGENNTFIGRNSAAWIVTGSSNVSLGDRSITGAGGFTGTYTGNTALGASTSIGSTTGAINRTVIGYGATVSSDNTIVLGNGADVLIGLSTTTGYKFDVIGTSRFNGNMSVTGSIVATSFTGSLLGSSSYSTTASYALIAQNVLGSITSASYALSASYSTTAQTLLGSVVSASYALSASYAPNSGGGLKTKAGAIANTSFTGTPETATVTFGAAFTDANYAIAITGEDARIWTVESKTTSGFTINSNSSQNIAGTTYWNAIAYGES